MCAVIDQDVELIKALIDSGADLEARDRQGQTTLYHAFPDIPTQSKTSLSNTSVENW